MDRKRLPTSIKINNVECKFKSDFRDILYIFEIMNDPDLLESEQIVLSLENFYEDDNYLEDVDIAAKEMMDFISMGSEDNTPHQPQKPLYDWEQDFNIIVAPINRILNQDVRGIDYLHWWTFLSAFMEIGECTFNTYVGIRDKLNKGKKLDKAEEKIYKDNQDKIVLKKKYDSGTQSLIDEILGKG